MDEDCRTKRKKTKSEHSLEAEIEELPRPDFSNIVLTRGSRASRKLNKSSHKIDPISKRSCSNKKKAFKCKFCPRTYAIKGKSLINHEGKCNFNPNKATNDQQIVMPINQDKTPTQRTKTTDNRFMCNFCPRTFAHDGKILKNHEANHLTVSAFTRNNNVFILNKGVKNFPKSNDLKFLNDYKLTPYDRNTRKEEQFDKSAIFLDQGFSGKSQLNSKEKQTCESTVSNYLLKYFNNLKIACLNINSFDSKYGDILFLLSKQLVDVLVINESKLSEKNDMTCFISMNFMISIGETGRG